MIVNNKTVICESILYTLGVKYITSKFNFKYKYEC